MVDFLIIGQGLGGSILAYQLIQQNKSVIIIDNGKPSASKIAIGLVNPITGKRLVKSWRIDEFLPKAKSFYQTLETQFQQQFIHFNDIYRVIPNEDILHQWRPNLELAIAENYIAPTIESIYVNDKKLDYFKILQSFWLNTELLLQHLTDFFLQNSSLKLINFEYEKLAVDEYCITYEGIKAKQIIFCEGAAARFNPYFNQLPFNVNKGEIIDVQVTNYPIDGILKKNIFIVPTGNYYRIGSTYNREEINDIPSKEALTYFNQKSKDLLAEEYNILQHRAGIRPATKDRRPFIGTHPTYQNIHMFNGFGAKGVSLIPYFADEMLNYLLHNQSISPEINLMRYFETHA